MRPFEADNDVIDVEVWSTTGKLINAFQFKRRSEAYTWGQQELIDELTTWSGVGHHHSRATYHFVTDGRLGPTGRNLQEPLANAANGDLAAIKLLLEEKAKSAVDLDTMRRAKIVVDEARATNAVPGRLWAGPTYERIARALTAEGILTPLGKPSWQASTVRRIYTSATSFG